MEMGMRPFIRRLEDNAVLSWLPDSITVAPASVIQLF